LKFSPGEVADLERGKIVRHALDANAPGEIATVGAVRVNARKEVLIKRLSGHHPVQARTRRVAESVA